MKAYIEPYSPEMREEVVNLKLRPADVEELLASSGLSTKEALEQSLDLSLMTTWVIKQGSIIIGVFGISPHPLTKDIGIPWLLATEAINKTKKSFIQGCKTIIQDFHVRYETLVNFIDTRQRKSILWLSWLYFYFSIDDY